MYLGPETIVPLASILAAIGGFVLMLWHRIIVLFRITWSFVSRIVGRG